MNWKDFKQRIVEVLKEHDEPMDVDEKKYPFRDSFHYKLISVLIGFLLVISVMCAFKPEMATEIYYTIPEDGFTFTALFVISLVGYVTIQGCGLAGSWIVDKALVIGNGIINKVPMPELVKEAFVIIGLIVVILIKIYLGGGGLRV